MLILTNNYDNNYCYRRQNKLQNMTPHFLGHPHHIGTVRTRAAAVVHSGHHIWLFPTVKLIVDMNLIFKLKHPQFVFLFNCSLLTYLIHRSKTLQLYTLIPYTWTSEMMCLQFFNNGNNWTDQLIVMVVWLFQRPIILYKMTAMTRQFVFIHTHGETPQGDHRCGCAEWKNHHKASPNLHRSNYRVRILCPISVRLLERTHVSSHFTLKQDI